MKYIISLSGGIGSWCCLCRMLEKHSKEDIECVFCDTLYEDGDLYRFLDDIERYHGIEITRLCVGKTPFELSWEEKFLFNSRVAKCSMELKSKPFASWLKAHYSPDDAIICLGIDWTESHRKAAIVRNYAPYTVRFPLCEPPYVDKPEMLEELRKTGIAVPRLYALGFSHNNCKGCCFKAGIGHYRNLLEKDPVTFREMENKEEAMRRMIGKDVSILKRKGKPFTLRQLRESPQQLTFDELCEIGGCGCFADNEEGLFSEEAEQCNLK